MKRIRVPMMLAAALAFLSLSTAALAAPPSSQSDSAMNATPTTATFVDSGTHAIGALNSMWYEFNYAGDRSEITITLPNGQVSGLGFRIFTPSEAADWTEAAPVGQGTAQAVRCGNGTPANNGTCRSDDLTWVGNFDQGGTYYVEVTNPTTADLRFSLSAAGSGVSLQ